MKTCSRNFMLGNHLCICFKGDKTKKTYIYMNDHVTLGQTVAFCEHFGKRKMEIL